MFKTIEIKSVNGSDATKSEDKKEYLKGIGKNMFANFHTQPVPIINLSKKPSK